MQLSVNTITCKYKEVFYSLRNSAFTKVSFRQKEKGSNNTEQKVTSKSRTSNTENVKERLYKYNVQPRGQKREKNERLDEVKFSTKFSLNKIRLLVNREFCVCCKGIFDG